MFVVVLEQGSLSCPLTPLFFQPSISPYYFRNLGGFNPRIRVYNYSLTSTSSMTLHNFLQFYVNLSNISTENLNSNTPWNLEYSATSAYNLTNLSSHSLAALLDRLGSNRNLWCGYWNRELGGVEHVSGPCPELNSERHCRHLCVLRHLNYKRMDACLAACNESSAITSARSLPKQMEESGTEKVSENWNALPVVALVIIAFLAILIGVVLLANRELCRKGRRVSDRRAFRRRVYAREGLLTSYNQVGLNAISAVPRLSATQDIELGEEEEKKALNLSMADDRAYDADASGDEEEVFVDNSSRLSVDGRRTGGDEFFSVHSSLQRLCPQNLADVGFEGHRPSGDDSHV